MDKNKTGSCIYTVNDFELMKAKVLNWAQQFNTFCFLDNHQYHIEPHAVECLLAAGTKRKLSCNTGTALQRLQSFIDEKKSKSWFFGHLGYDLKNEIEELSSHNPDHLEFPDLFFFEPEIVIKLSAQEMLIESSQPDLVYATLIQNGKQAGRDAGDSFRIRNRFNKEKYISTVEKLKHHILRGDSYEINFCQEFFSDEACVDPLVIYKKLSEVSPNPFSALYRMDDKWLICASPERFLKKIGKKILSQPIKGTSKRITSDDADDEKSKELLLNSKKDRAENVMVVDLVRNDLAKICVEGTVKADELYGVYSFPQVHQMISTVSGELKDEIKFSEIIRATFPMGSMTGAPKKRVMQLIEQYEKSKRGIFSGAVGYISPDGDFDFNVVIRSIMYNSGKKYLSYQAGSGITYYSDPASEWDECLLKGEAIKKVLEE